MRVVQELGVLRVAARVEIESKLQKRSIIFRPQGSNADTTRSQAGVKPGPTWGQPAPSYLGLLPVPQVGQVRNKRGVLQVLLRRQVCGPGVGFAGVVENAW
jgi:hypothetical protein